MPIVSETVVQPQTYVRLETSWADEPAVDFVRFVRVNPETCEEVVVRVHTCFDETGEYIALSCDDTAVVWDTEAPLGVDLEYRVEGLGTTTTVTSATVNIDDNGELHLKDPLRPCRDQRIALCIDDPSCTDDEVGVYYLGHSSDLHAAHHENFLPVMSSYPITVSRPRQAPSSMLGLGTQLCEDADAMELLMSEGTPLLFQALPEYCIDDRYVSVQDYEVSRIGVDQRLEVRNHSLPYLTVQRPTGPGYGPCGVRWQDLCDIYETWDDMAAAGLTWNDLLLGYASGDTGLSRVTWADVEAGFANWAAVEANGTWADLRDGT